MNYTLMHKQIRVADLGFDDESLVVLKIGDMYTPMHVPVGIGFVGDKPDRKHLNDWWTRRAIPTNRSGLWDALEIMDIPYAQKLLAKCYGLSLSDQYWINPAEQPQRWDDINFFDNPFSEDVGNALFGKAPENGELDLFSPDNTSDGWLKKKWTIIDRKRFLVKGGSNPFRQEPLNEALATAVMRRLGVPHVPYTVVYEDEQPYSVCEDFITPQTDLVSAWNIARTMKKENSVSTYRHFLDCCHELGIPGAVEGLDRMLAVDYIIANTDRHYNNFGAVRNAETLEWLGLAPLYDCGTSLWHDSLLNDAQAPSKAKSKPFRSSHDEQIKLVTDWSWLDLSALNGIAGEFADILSASPTIDAQRRTALCRALEARIERLNRYIRALNPQYAVAESSRQDEAEDELEL